jgi:hypothetical protein
MEIFKMVPWLLLATQMLVVIHENNAFGFLLLSRNIIYAKILIIALQGNFGMGG